jgi:cobalt-precorrin 5A hydrolase
LQELASNWRCRCCISAANSLPAATEPSFADRLERTGCYGMAESAALALAEQLIQAPAKLLISRQKYAQATWHWPALRKSR